MKTFTAGLFVVTLALAFPQIARGTDTNTVFGLTNVSIGDAILNGNIVTNLTSSGPHGVSILLGEADSGVFAAPDTTAVVEAGDYMLGMAYGKLNGVPDQLVATVRGRKVDNGNGFGIYPVLVDFSPLRVSGLRAQVFSRGGVLTGESLLHSNEPVMHTEFNGYKISRVNPFWRTPDGGIAAVLEFGGSTAFELPGEQILPPLQPSPEDNHYPFGTRLVIHALNPTGVVEFISRVDIVTGWRDDADGEVGAGVDTFQMNDVRPGYFGRPHRALGNVVFNAKGGRVTVVDPSPGSVIEPGMWNTGLPWETGVFVEFDHASRGRVDLQPLELPDSTNSSFAVSAVGTLAGGFLQGQEGHFLGFIRLRRGIDSLLLDGLMPPLGTNAQQVRLAVYDSGTLVSMTPLLTQEGRLTPVALTGNPRITGAGALANSLQSTPGLSIVFDTNTTVLITNGADFFSLTGNEVRVLSVGPIYLDSPLVEAWFESVDGVALLSTGLPEFTIVGEQEQPRDTPRLSIERVGQQVRLSWLDANRVYTLQTSKVLFPGFDQDGLEVFNTNGAASARATVSTNGNLFFRLVHTRAYFD